MNVKIRREPPLGTRPAGLAGIRWVPSSGMSYKSMGCFAKHEPRSPTMSMSTSSHSCRKTPQTSIPSEIHQPVDSVSSAARQIRGQKPGRLAPLHVIHTEWGRRKLFDTVAADKPGRRGWVGGPAGEIAFATMGWVGIDGVTSCRRSAGSLVCACRDRYDRYKKDAEGRIWRAAGEATRHDRGSS